MSANMCSPGGMNSAGSHGKARRVHNLVFCPSGFDSCADCSSSHAKFLRGLAHCFSCAEVKRPVLVVALFLRSCPTHVSEFVVAITVRKAIQRVLRGWPLPHFFEKRSEGITPRSADRNSATTVAREPPGVGVRAALNYSTPNSKLSGASLASCLASCMAMCQGCFRGSFALQATARLSVALRQIVQEWRLFCSAGTAAQDPSSFPAFMRQQFTQHYEATKMLSWSDFFVSCRHVLRLPLMTRVLAFIVFWMLLWAAPVVGQEIEPVARPDLPPTLSDEVILLRVDLMAQRSETIQARLDRLLAQRQLLDMDIENFRLDQAALQVELDAHCGSPYDMVTRSCTVPVAPAQPPATDEGDPS